MTEFNDAAAERKKREVEFHAQVIAPKADTSRVSQEVIERYRTLKHWNIFPKEFAIKALGDLSDKEICEVGCGDGKMSIQLSLLGARKVVALDLSPELVEIARKNLENHGIPEDRVSFRVEDAEELDLDQKFDVVFIFSVLHHMNIAKTMPNVARILKDNGKAVILEPVNFSKGLKTLRRFVPVPLEVTPDERQFDEDDLEVIRGVFGSTETRYYRFLSRLERFLPNRHKIEKGHLLTRLILLTLYWADQRIISLFPWMRKYYGYTVIVGRKTSA